jgi:hypothetical protein
VDIVQKCLHLTVRLLTRGHNDEDIESDSESMESTNRVPDRRRLPNHSLVYRILKMTVTDLHDNIGRYQAFIIILVNFHFIGSWLHWPTVDTCNPWVHVPVMG